MHLIANKREDMFCEMSISGLLLSSTCSLATLRTEEDPMLHDIILMVTIFHHYPRKGKDFLHFHDSIFGPLSRDSSCINHVRLKTGNCRSK